MIKFVHVNIDITPVGESGPLAGFLNRGSYGVSLGDTQLNLDLIWFKFPISEICFVVIDSLYFPQELAGRISEILFDNFSVTKDSLIFSSTHTHSAPNISWPINGEINREYIKYIINKFSNRIQKGIVFHEGELTVESYKAPKLYSDNIINRRSYVRDIRSLFRKKTVMLPNFTARVDEDIRVIRARSSCREHNILIYNLSCHPVFNTSSSQSSDFIGSVDKSILNKTGETAIFLQGFCGDIRPKVINQGCDFSSISSFVKSVLYKSFFSRPTRENFDSFVSSVVSAIATKGVNSENINSLAWLVKDFNFYSETGETEMLRSIKFFKLGSAVGISIPGEVLSGYLFHLQKEFPNTRFFPLGFSAGMIGYLPHSNDFFLGGYEVDSYKNYGWDSRISYDCLVSFDIFLKEQVRSLIQKATV